MFDSLISWLSDPWNVVSAVMSTIAFIGSVMNAERSKWGFAFWLVSDVYMCVRFFVIGEYAQSVLFFLYTVVVIRGIFAWTKKETKEEKAKENC